MELKGLLKKRFKPESGVGKESGKQWTKMGFVILQEGKYPKTVYVETLNTGVINFISYCNKDTELTLQCEAASREYQGRYFTSISCYSATADKKAEGGKRAYAKQEEDDSLPF